MAKAPLKLDRDYLIQILRSDDFYVAVPELRYLQESVREADRYLRAMAGCVKCKHEWNVMRGVVDAFFMKLRDLCEQRHPAVARLKDWLSYKKGYPVTQCVVYYRRSRTQGRIAKLKF